MYFLKGKVKYSDVLCVHVAVSLDESQSSIDGFLSKSDKSYSVTNHNHIRKTASVVDNVIVGCGLPLSIVENPHFVNFCKDMDLLFHLPSRSYLSRQLLPNAVSRKENALV
jgi:hypothetical protein